MRGRLIVVGLVLVFLVLTAGCGGGLPEGAVAKVGQVTITQAQFDARVKEIETRYKDEVPSKEDKAAYQRFRSQVLDYMATLELIRQRSPILKISVTDQDVQKELDNIKKMVGGDKQFEEALKQQGLKLDQLKRDLRERVLFTKAIEVITKDAKVTDAEIKAEYEKRKESFREPETRKARHILFSPRKAGTSDAAGQPTEKEWQAALAQAEKVRKEILAGADFGEKAKQYSQDPGTKDLGGDLGIVSPGQMVPEFEKALFALKKGEISQPVRTQYGYHLIQATEVNPAKQRTLEEVKEELRSDLLNERKRKLWDDWLEKNKAELKVVYAEGLAPTTTTSTTVSASTDTSDTTATARAK